MVLEVGLVCEDVKVVEVLLCAAALACWLWYGLYDVIVVNELLCVDSVVCLIEWGRVCCSSTPCQGQCCLISMQGRGIYQGCCACDVSSGLYVVRSRAAGGSYSVSWCRVVEDAAMCSCGSCFCRRREWCRVTFCNTCCCSACIGWLYACTTGAMLLRVHWRMSACAGGAASVCVSRVPSNVAALAGCVLPAFYVSSMCGLQDC
jgi:hypothetical protein